MTKKIKIILIFSFSILIILFSIVFYLAKQEELEFKNKGLVTEANVLAIEQQVSVSKGVRHNRYTMQVSFFSEVPNETKPQNNKEEGKNKSLQSKSERLLDSIFSSIKIKPIGNYQTTTFAISSKAAKTYKRGDKVTIVYLPETPNKAKLHEELY